MSISVTNLSKNYGEQKAVHQVSFRVNQGEIVGFLGPNGAGKSTTMKMITGYLSSDSGEIEVCGLPVRGNSIETKRKIGYLPNPLYMDMYVREYLAFIAGIHQISQAKQRINEVIETVGLTPEAHKKINQLSKGYKQRVGLAAALVHNPEVLILDEPTSGLDPNQIVEIRNVIRNLATEKTILFSSHIMQEVEAICDRVIIINKGTIVADDKLKNLQERSVNSHSVLVEFKEPVNVHLLQQMKGVTAVTDIQHTVMPPGRHIFNIACSDISQVKKELLQLSVVHNMNIVSLQSEAKNLESIFKSLTT